MTKYIVKLTQTATDLNMYEDTGTTRVYYIGKGDVISTMLKTFIYIYEGWKSKGWAERYIRQQKKYNEEYPNECWDFTYEIIQLD